MKVLDDFAARMGMSYRVGPQGSELEGTVRGVPLRTGHVTRPAWNGRGHRTPIRFTGRPPRPRPTVIVRDRDAPSEMRPGNDRAEAMKIDASEVFIEFDGSSGTHHEPPRLERIVNVVANLCAPLALR